MVTVSQNTQEKIEKTLITILEPLKKIGLITLIISLISSLSFLVTYSFLFGYYFGGDLKSSISNFELIRTFIPFDLNTILFTYLLLGLSITLILYLVQVFILKGWITKIVVLFLCIGFHVILTTFFTKDLSVENFIKFGLIWVFPFSSSILIMFFIRGIKNIFKITAGSIFGSLTCLILIVLFQDNIQEIYIETLLILLTLIFGIIFTFLPFNRIWNLLFVFPFVFFLFLY